ncbi:hypothetical protein MCOR07_003265 [Pyricularia oryzae]|uniref:Fucose-specific lectin n=1 Tax=Pyricularia grisea TaxID=148305 RepID=A0ABQ8NY18_PYRGI|nr:hypothetical protein MCOR01_009291 [Pyricularia oryzae]KAI6303770.1 hypothetical protein MCOR33_001121 [Pyricularia grisea]KAI6261412.1 hypothetical protein MCOR19_002318 [Pyricularia oryzae]KAI6271104.1 hypothetical protein MCOR26_007945 [Pyricularia oryzae]KAI6329812.1 hypothetical protein MCOR29_002149 [Pyricularia oryzae]
MATPNTLSPSRHGADDSSKQVYEPSDRYAEVMPGQNAPSPLEQQPYDAPVPTHVYYDSQHKEPAAAYYHNVEGYAQQQQQQHYQHQAYHPAPNSPKVSASTPLTNNSDKAGQQGARKRPSWLVAAGVALVAALIAAAVSGIAVWKATESKGAGTGTGTCEATVGPDGRPNPTGGKNGDAVTCPAIMGTSVGGVDKAIRQNSGLAAIGWRTKDEQYMQLFYQDADDNLMTSWFGSMFVNWTVPRKVAMRPGDKAMGGTPLAVSTIWFETNVVDEYMAQNQMNYLAPNGTVRGYNFRLIWPMGLPDGIMLTSYSASTQSSLSSLWPLQHYQDSDGAIFEVTQVNDRAKLTDVPNAGKGTPLLALPVAAKHASKEVRLFYRNTDGNLALYERDSTGKATDATASLGIPIPADAKLAGFANARAATGPGINTFVLWQDGSRAEDNGGIRILSQTDGGKDWKGPASDPVFKDADVPTHVTCVNEGMGGSDISGQLGVALTTSSDMNRCFFQAGRRLKQVWHDGKQWVDLGFVLMP